MEKAVSRRKFMKDLGALGAVLIAGRDLETLAQDFWQPKKYTLNDYVDAVIEVESHGRPNSERYESNMNDTSYGLGQILTRTAVDLEKRHPGLPRLGNASSEIKEALLNPGINREYTAALFKEELDFYGDPFLAVAAYNSGHLTPRNARTQQQLNELYNSGLVTDGIVGRESRKLVKKFQREYNLDVDGVIGPQTYSKLQEVWREKFSDRENPIGIIPTNKYTPNHVNKFRRALEN